MKMHKPKSTCSLWMEQSYNFAGTTADEDDDDGYGPLDSVVSYSDAETYGPHSVASFPPSVGPESDAFLQTPYSVLAPVSPTCVTPSEYPDSEINRPSDDVHELSDFSSAKKALFSEHGISEIHQQNVHRANIFRGRADTQTSGFSRLDVNCALPQLENKTDVFLREESLAIYSPATVANIQDSENVSTEQSLDTNPLEERRMSWEEFIASIGPDELMENNLQNSKQDGNVVDVDASNMLVNGVAKSANVANYTNTNCVRKRPAPKSIFSNPDFSDSDNEIPVKRQMLTANQKNQTSNYKAVKTNNPGSHVDDSSGKQTVSLVPDVDNIDSERETYSIGSQNPAYSFSPSNSTSHLHHSSSDTGQFCQVVQRAHPPSFAFTKSSTSTVDHNGNLVQTSSETTGNHISPWFVGERASQGQHKTSAGRNENARFQMQHLRTSRTQSAQLDMNTSASVALETRPDHLPLTAELITNSTQEIMAKLPNYHDATVSSTVFKSDSENQNFNLTNSHIPTHQGSQSNSNISLMHLNLEKPLTLHHAVVACNREARISATTTTSAHIASSSNDICQQQTVGTSMNSFNLSTRADGLSHDAENSDSTCLPIDAITAEMFAKSRTENVLSLQDVTFSNPTTAVGHHDVIVIRDDWAPGDMTGALPSNNLFSATPTSTIGYKDFLEDGQECISIDPGIVSREVYLVIQDSSNVIDSTHNRVVNTHTGAPDKDDILNGTSSQPQYDIPPDNPAAELIGDTFSALDYQDACLIPHGSTFATTNKNYITDTNLDILATSRNSEDNFHCSHVKQETPVGDLLFQATSSDGDTSSVGEVKQSVLTGDVSLAESDSGMGHLSGLPGSDGAGSKFKDTGQTSANVKQSLKSAILTKRKMEGKAEIDTSFQPERHCQLTKEELEKEKRRKELNRVAAANHRKKNKTTKQSQEQEYDKLKETNCQLKETIAKKESEKAYYLKQLQDLGLL